MHCMLHRRLIVMHKSFVTTAAIPGGGAGDSRENERGEGPLYILLINTRGLLYLGKKGREIKIRLRKKNSGAVTAGWGF